MSPTAYTFLQPILWLMPPTGGGKKWGIARGGYPTGVAGGRKD